MRTEWEKFYQNNRYVDEQLLERLDQLPPTIQKVDFKSAGYAINHPLDSSLFREAIKDSARRTNPEHIAAVTHLIR